MLTRRQIYTLLIVISTGLMLGRIVAVNRTDMQELQKSRFNAVNATYADREKQLRADENATEEQFAALEERKQQALANERRELPFFSANDRSRWNTIRVLVEPDMRMESPNGNTVWYAIDKAQNVRGWDTIDMVKHNNVAAGLSFGDAIQQTGKELAEKVPALIEQIYSVWHIETENSIPKQLDTESDIIPGQVAPGYLYSSKPPLLPTLMAVPYAVMYWASSGELSLEKEPFLVARVTLIICNLLPLVLCWFLLSRLIEQFGTTNWGRVFSVAFICFGTFLSTFAVTLNNHIPGMVSVTIAFYCVVRIIHDKETRWWYFLLAGFFSAFAVACEKPALLFCCLMGLWLFWHQWRRTLLLFLPASLLVAAAFFATNYVAHHTFLPAYSQPDWYIYEYERNGRVIDSYWKNPQDFDKGEEDRGTYIFHATVGHHGLFSLTPVWALSIIGLGIWLFDKRYRSMAVLFLFTSVVVFAFYMGLKQELRNYGGNTSALRWLFWLAPLWSVALVAAADQFSKNALTRGIALACLIVSVMSAAYPIWNPWTMPWTFNLLRYFGG